MKIIYYNLIDIPTTTVTASSTAAGFSADNLKNNIKTRVHRSGGSSVTYTVTFASAQTLDCIALPATNLLNGATITTSIPGLIGPYQACQNRKVLLQDGTSQPYYQHFTFGGATKTSLFLTSPVTISSFTITLNSNNGTAIDCSRIICGRSWTSTRLPSNGLSINTVDNSEISTTRSGNTYVDKKYIQESLNLNLEYLIDTDRVELLNIIRSWGSSGFIFVCPFPDNNNPEITQSYSIYGRNQSNSIEYVLFSLYRASLDIQSW